MGVGKLKNGKATGKDKITGEMIKGRGDRLVEWIWRLCNMAFERGDVPKYCMKHSLYLFLYI